MNDKTNLNMKSYIYERKNNYRKTFLGRTLLILLIGLLAPLGKAWAADYVLAYRNGNTVYYLARNGTTGVTCVTTFDPTTCVWSCSSNAAGTTASTLDNTNNRYLFQYGDGTRRFLRGRYLTLNTNPNDNYYSRWRMNGDGFVYERYNGTNSYFINLSGGSVANATSSSSTCAKAYLYNSVILNNR